MRIRYLLTSLMLLLAAGSVGCSGEVSIGTGKRVVAADLEEQVTSQIVQQLQTSSVTCPHDLKGKVGATTTCTVVADDLTYTATVTATKVEGSHVSFKVKVPPPATVVKSSLQRRVKATLAEQAPGGVKSVTCQGDLVGTVGETAACTVTPGTGAPVNVVVTVTSADFTNVSFSIESID